MPRDFAIDAEHDLIQIRDRAGIGLPFSKGIMATSILATGLETSHAYRIAAEIQRDLQRDLQRGGERELEAHQLAELAAEAIGLSAGDEMANRYRAWRKAKRAGHPIVLCLAGAPGVGKSTLATRLALRLGINRLVPTDAIREVLRTVIPDTVLPELHVSTYQQLDAEADGGAVAVFMRQARAVSAAAAAVASRLVAERRSVILEGVHVVPGDVRERLAAGGSDAIVVELLLTLADEDLHRAQLLRRVRSEPARDGQRHLRHLAAIRHQQQELRRLATVAGVDEHDIAHPEDLTQHIVDDVVAQVEARAGGVPTGA